MDTKTKLTAVALLTLISFAAGRYTGQSETVKTDTKLTDDYSKAVSTHEQQVTQTTKEKDGTVITIVTTTKDTNTSNTDDKTSDVSKSVQIIASKAIVHLDLLAGLQTTLSRKPIYGASINKEILGPVSVGVFGLTNGTIGASIGITF